MSKSTILFFGDSITVGQELAAPGIERWSSRVATAFDAVEINEGRGGRPASALDEFRAILAGAKEGITHLVIALGSNDARENVPAIAAEVAANVATQIGLARAAFPAWKIVVCGPYDIHAAYLERQDIAAYRGRNLEAIGSALRAMAAAEGVPFVDFAGVLPPRSLTHDGVHPDASGHAALASAFLAQLPSLP
ncbi:acyl-CoA thioesterase-1 [Verrucomicrobium sp. GAS474]|uniref:SGNH/GDSL hydrolase family protein n=1 Tax=Verrucomicrobium sp. GAS474 TaxID=1882831 RepID=UPI00087BD16B|nr:SGNH/GDSL hydrolase family protein [Verrucomicrobium sp. GAS474]SDU05265.1 acyl-CoA thioesterase-1 [Verrucomicrobium sp. GAS474]